MKALLPIILLLTAGYAIAQEFKPVNKDANEGTRKTLAFLYDIKGKYILSGQQNYNSDLNTFSDSAKAITGKYPAIWASEFINWGDKDLGTQIVSEAIKKWHEGYLITLMWHEGKPTDNPPYEFSKNVIAKMSDAEWEQLITPGSELNKNGWPKLM